MGSLAVIESSDEIDGDYHNSFYSPSYSYFIAIICYDYYHLECSHEGNQFKEIPNIMDLLSEFWQGAWFVQYNYSCIIEYRSRPLKWLNSL